MILFKGTEDMYNIQFTLSPKQINEQDRNTKYCESKQRNTAKANSSTLTSEVTNGAVMDTLPGGL